MEKILNERKIRIVEYSTEKNWFDLLPDRNWLCVLVINDKPRRYVDEVISKILAKDVGYLCTIGNQCEQVHDLFDEEIEYRDAEIENNYLPKHHIMTTWHHEFEEGIWFAVYAAYGDEVEIEEVVILDMTDGVEIPRVKAYLKELKNQSEGNK